MMKFKLNNLAINIFKASSLALGVLCLTTTLTGCSTMQQNPNGSLDKTPDISKAVSPSQRSMQLGINAINAGNPKLANQEFTLAIKQDLKNPALHTANALAYQIRTRAGERDMFELAETGYLIALEQQHDFQNAAVQLAHLYLENKHYAKAQRAAAYAIKLESKSVEALYLLASASYSLGDAELALWAIDQARSYAPNDKRGAKMLPAIYGAAGLTDEANLFLTEQPTTFNKLDGDKIRARLDQWKVAYNTIDSTDNPKIKVAINEAEISSDNEDEKTPEAKNQAIKSDDQGPMAYAWSDCVQQLTPSVNNSTDSSSSSDTSSTGATKVDETMAMPSLPSPCKAHPMPQMAIIDVVILRTNEISTRSSGINLLENLAVTIQQSSNKVTTSLDNAASTTSSTLTRNVGLGTSAGGAIAYSLNIANISGQTTEVVSRPSLQVLDRQPAQFFSGSSIQIGLAGAVGGSSTLNEVNVGLSMSVTPTFLDDGQLLLNVKAVHTFFEPVTGTSTFSQSLQTSRNMVAAATKIRVDETLVLSGLTEREAISGTSGVPILKDIPGLQYLFSKNTVQNFNKTVLILITPRRIMAYGETLEKVDELKKSLDKEPKVLHETRQQALKELGGRWPNLYRTFRNMSRSERAFGVRANDIELEDWNRPSRIKKILDDAVNTLHF
jgi:Tfp pilus assembly protein PilF